jgi:hypothetical protein
LIVEQAAWGGDDIASDPQGDVLIDLLNRVEAAGELAEEALQKSTEANSKYDACVEATEAANRVAEEARAVLDPAAELLDELVAIRVDAGIGTYQFEDDVLSIKAEITTNGAVAHLFVSLNDLQLDGGSDYNFVTIPAEFSPFEEQVSLQQRLGDNIEVTLMADKGLDCAMLLFHNAGDDAVTLSGTASVTYDLADLRIAGGAEGGHITVDAELSETSENPVQNKVITALFNEASEVLTQLGGAVGTLQTGITVLGEKTLPDVTAADDGKFLRVVAGKWVAETVPSAEEATF